jgi:hypothetical protein
MKGWVETHACQLALSLLHGSALRLRAEAASKLRLAKRQPV